MTAAVRSCDSAVRTDAESAFRNSSISLASFLKLLYAIAVVCGVYPPRPLSFVPDSVQILLKDGHRMIRKNGRLTLAAAVVMVLSLAACKDTKTLQENEQLKAQVADLQRQNGQLGNNLETVTAARDALMKENSALMAEMKASKKKHPAKRSAKKGSKKKHHRQSARQFGNVLTVENAA